MPASFHLFCAFSKCQSYISKLHLCHYNCYPRQLINLIQLALPSNPFMHASLRHRKVGLEFVISSLSSNLKHHQCIILTSGANVSNDCKSTKGSKTCREISFSQKMLNIEIPAFLQRNVNVWKVYYLRSESVFIAIHEQIFPKSFIWHMLSLKQ